MLKLFEGLTHEIEELSLSGSVSVIQVPINTLDFYRNFVSRNVPCIVEKITDDWGAFGNWNKTYLSDKCGDNEVTVDFTPDGRGDAVVKDSLNGEELFVTPFSKKMTLDAFFDVLEQSRQPLQNVVPYVQHQNGNLLKEFPMLLDDVPSSLSFADEMFGSKPDAVNLWIGDERSVTSFHKDDEYRLTYKYFFDDELPKPLRIRVEAGQTLYLPSLWYHYVEQIPDSQENIVIAVNYWYDMDFDVKYAYFKTVEKLAMMEGFIL